MTTSAMTAFTIAGKGMRRAASFQRLSTSALDALVISSSTPDSTRNQSYANKAACCDTFSNITTSVIERVKTLASALVSFVLHPGMKYASN